MELVEVWRVRRGLAWFVGFLLLFVVVAVALPGRTSDRQPVGASVSLTYAMWCTVFLALWCGFSLCRENATRELSWTRPISRVQLAARWIAIDVVALAGGYLLAWAAMLAITIVGGHHAVYVDSAAGLTAFVGLGVDVMLFALVLLASIALGDRGRLIGSLIWPVSLVLVWIAERPAAGQLQTLARVIDVINPWAYASTGVHGSPWLWDLGRWQSGTAAWMFAAAYAVVATAVWKRQEV